MDSATTAQGRTFFTMGRSGPRTIISVYPQALEHSLQHEGRTIYKIDAAPRDGFTTLVVPDTFASLRQPSTGNYYQAPVPASVVADNLVDTWTRGRIGSTGDVGPGILVCVGEEPTEAEIGAARARQEAYFRRLIEDADARFAKEGTVNITGDHRMAAEWMGVKDRKWAQPISAIEMVKCPACAEDIKEGAIICRHCHTNIEKFLQARETQERKRA